MPAAKNSKKEMLIRDKELAFSQAHSTIALYVGNSECYLVCLAFLKTSTSSNCLAEPFEKESLP